MDDSALTSSRLKIREQLKDPALAEHQEFQAPFNDAIKVVINMKPT